MFAGSLVNGCLLCYNTVKSDVNGKTVWTREN